MGWSVNFKLTYGIESPCLRCEKRKPACHDQCNSYKDYKTRIDEVKKKMWRAKEEERRVHPGIKRSKGKT